MMTLAMASPGEDVRLTAIRGGQRMRSGVFGQLALAWLMAFVIFQGGRLLGLG
ncbi:MAG TPA: hypothetical protein G4N98_00345 [Thermoflexia bacterium]|nr:hypothetical protein [Thermoflexia bacterium]